MQEAGIDPIAPGLIGVLESGDEELEKVKKEVLEDMKLAREEKEKAAVPPMARKTSAQPMGDRRVQDQRIARAMASFHAHAREIIAMSREEWINRNLGAEADEA